LEDELDKETLLYNLNDFKNHGMYYFNEKSGIVVHCGLRCFDDPTAMDWFGSQKFLIPLTLEEPLLMYHPMNHIWEAILQILRRVHAFCRFDLENKVKDIWAALYFYDNLFITLSSDAFMNMRNGIVLN
jgi:hypothetical protein